MATHFLDYATGAITQTTTLGDGISPEVVVSVTEVTARKTFGKDSEDNPTGYLVCLEYNSQVLGNARYFLAWIDPTLLELNGVACEDAEQFMDWAAEAMQSASVDISLLELVANKATDFTSPNNTTYPTTAAVAAEIQTQILSSNSPLVLVATNGALHDSPTYNNGSSGVGATLTSGSNSHLNINGYSVHANDRILVKDQSNAAHNGIYIVTATGGGGSPYILTRTTDYDTVTEIEDNPNVAVQQYVNDDADTEVNTIWRRIGTVATIGTSPLIFEQYTLGANIVAINTEGLSQFPDDSTTKQDLIDLVSDAIPAFTDVAQSFTKGQAGAITALTDAATIAVDLSLSNHFEVVLGGSRTLGEPTNIRQGQTGKIDIYQDATGGRTITLAWCYTLASASPTLLSTGKFVKDMLIYSVDKYATSTVTISIASPGVVTWNNHGLRSGQKLRLTTTGALPTGLAVDTTYFVFVVDANTFRLSTTRANLQAGTYINTSGSQSGTHTARVIMITASLALDTNA